MPAIPPPIAHRLAQLARTPAALAYMRAARDPRGHQRKRLLELVRANADTDYGRRHGFAQVDGFDTYRERVPIIGPAELAPWVDRMIAGERKVLTVEDPVFYGTSTGTTGEPKKIPINETYRADFQRSVMVSMWYIYWKRPAAFRHKLLYFVAPRCDARTPDGIELGAISGYNFTEMPEQVRSLYAWPYELIEVEDLSTRWYLALHIALQERISVIAGIFPVGLLMLLRELEARADELATHLEDGTLPDRLVLTDAQRAFFARYRKQAPEAAARLRRAAAGPPDEMVRGVFPDLAAVVCWKAASASLYVPELERRLGPDIPVFDAVYSATEGWCTAPMGEATNGGPLTLTAHVYEFIDEEVVEAADGDVSKLQGAPTRLVDELEEGGRYYIVLSTTAGLYRYFLGDLLEVCGFHGEVPKLVFVRKFGASFNLAGELLVEAHVTQAVADAVAATGRAPLWFTFVPAAGEVPHYDMFIEFTDPDTDADTLAAFAQAVRGAIGSYCNNWDDFQADGALGPLRVHQVRPGTYDATLARWEREGRSLGQLKNSHLVRSRERLPCDPDADVVGVA
jgi:hypothetical protein